MTAGRMTALRDPTGATVHLWQAREQAAPARVNDAGLHGLERARDARPRAARATSSASCSAGPSSPRSPATASIKSGGQLNGGIRPPQDGEPTHWLVYFTAASVDDAIKAIKDAGGSVIAGPMDTPVGRSPRSATPGGRLRGLPGRTDD